MKLKGALLACAVAAGTIVSSQAGAVTFTLNNTGGAEEGTQARLGFDIATAYWASVLTDDVNITLNIGFSSLGPNILGSTGSSRAVGLNSDIYSALNGDRSSTLDNSAVGSLRPLTTVTTGPNAGESAISMIVNQGTSGGQLYSDRATRLDNDNSANNIGLAVNTSVMKALGFSVDSNGDAFEQPDGDITFSSDFTFDFNPSDGVAAGQIDFIGVAIHEIGHALGFVSGVDDYDYFTRNQAAVNRDGILDDYVVASTLDLFRYSAAGQLDWSTSSADKYFSIDGGATKLFGNASFSLGARNGDGNQASHWKEPDQATPCENFVGIMNPYICGGLEDDITAADLAAFDAMGWDIAFDVLGNPGYSFSTGDAYNQYFADDGAVPEAATWAQMIAGFGLLGVAARRRRARIVAAI
jgi:hypothetical protein